MLPLRVILSIHSRKFTKKLTSLLVKTTKKFSYQRGRGQAQGLLNICHCLYNTRVYIAHAIKRELGPLHKTIHAYITLLLLRLWLKFLIMFHFNVRQSLRTSLGWASVCPSVRLSVTRWYCVEMAQPIVKVSSLPGSSMILVL